MGAHPYPTSGTDLRRFPSATAEQARIRYFLQILRSAVRQRNYLNRKSRALPIETWQLQQWLDRNPCPSLSTVKAFPHFALLDRAMPHHTAGKRMINDARRIMMGVPLDAH